MKKIIIFIISLSLIGCGKISPISPQLDQRLNNTEGQIDELKNNQNGLMLELGKVNQKQEIIGRDIENAQEGLLNLKGSSNSGIQIFSGDSGLMSLIIILFALIYSIYHYRSKFLKSLKTSEILAQQIAIKNDSELNDKVFMSALNTEVEKDIYHIMIKNQALTGKK